MSARAAAQIIDAMKGPYVCLHRKYHGIDLRPHELTLRKLLAEIREAHDLALDDLETRSGAYWKARTGQPKPRRRWERNRLAKPAYDYSAFTPPKWQQQFMRQWEADYEAWYARAAANPRRSRTGEKLPLTPLDEVQTILRRWWKSLGRKWHPKAPDNALIHELNLSQMNLALRLFVLVAQTCDPRYTAQNCLRVSSRKKPDKRTS